MKSSARTKEKRGSKKKEGKVAASSNGTHAFAFSSSELGAVAAAMTRQNSATLIPGCPYLTPIYAHASR